jgi:hypothetical protein
VLSASVKGEVRNEYVRPIRWTKPSVLILDQLSIFRGGELPDAKLSPMVTHATVNSVGAGLMFPLFAGSALLLLWRIYGSSGCAGGLGALLFSANREGQLVL